MMQRDRDQKNYEDPPAYERSPAPIERCGAWGAGRVGLVQIPTPGRTNDKHPSPTGCRRRAKPMQPLASPKRCNGRANKENAPAEVGGADEPWPRPVTKPDGTAALVVDFEGHVAQIAEPERRCGAGDRRRQRRADRAQRLAKFASAGPARVVRIEGET